MLIEIKDWNPREKWEFFWIFKLFWIHHISHITSCIVNEKNEMTHRKKEHSSNPTPPPTSVLQKKSAMFYSQGIPSLSAICIK